MSGRPEVAAAGALAEALAVAVADVREKTDPVDVAAGLSDLIELVRLGLLPVLARARAIAVEDLVTERGSVAAAAEALGVSRARVYALVTPRRATSS